MLSPEKAAWQRLQKAFNEIEQQIQPQLRNWELSTTPDLLVLAPEDLPFSQWLYKGDSLVAWSRADMFFPGSHIALPDTLPLLVDSLAEGWYARWRAGSPAGYQLIVTLPVSGHYLPIRSGWQLSSTPQPWELSSVNGNRLCYIQIPDEWLPSKTRIAIVALMVILSVAAIVNTTRWAQSPGMQQQPLMKAILLGITAPGIYIFWEQFAQRAGFTAWKIFQPLPGSLPMLSSAAQHLIAALLLLWISALLRFHRNNFVKTMPLHWSLRLLLTQFLCIGIVWSFLYSWGRLLKGAGHYLQADTIFQIPAIGIVILYTGLLMAVTTFITVHHFQTRLIKVIDALPLRLGAAAFAAAGAALVLPAGALHLSAMELALGFFLFLVFFDLYAEQEAPGLIWLMVWVTIIAAFCAIFAQHILPLYFDQQGNPQLPRIMAFFSLCFSLLVVLAILLFSVNHYIKAIPVFFNGFKPSLRHKLQQYFLIYTLTGFGFMGWATGAYFKDATSQLDQLRIKDKINYLTTTVKQLPPEAVERQLTSLAAAYNTTLGLYSAQGILQQKATAPGIQSAELFPVMPPEWPAAHSTSTTSLPASPRDIYIPVTNKSDKTLFFIGLKDATAARQLNVQFLPLLEAFLTLYIFLLLASGAVAIAMSKSITNPIEQIGKQLSRVELDKNEPLQWHTNDEIGELISQYNNMIAKLEDSARQLKHTEREGAWREMAKQVAHEIKNPLTPMKLGVQYLQHAVKSRPEEAPQLITRTAQTMIEQIDNLTRIANEFSHFAQMPRPEIDECNLNQIVQAVGDLFDKSREEQDVAINCQIPDNPVLVFADRNQLLRVLNNLVKNAIQAIPDNRKGRIDISLCQRDDLAVIAVADNGDGIPENVREKVFYPNFTTKSSGTGLGLAMSKSIVEAAGGNLYFYTKTNEGTTFFVELPVLNEAKEHTE